MKIPGVIATWAVLGLTALSVGATDFPVREELKQDGWTIGFAPDDRALAEALANHIGDFEERYVAIESAKPDFGPADLELRAAELAAHAAAWCALPGKEPEFEQVFQQAASRARDTRTQVRAALLVRAIEIVRTDEIAARFATNEGNPGVRWIESEKRLVLDAHINLQSNFVNGEIAVSVIAPAAVMLQIEVEAEPQEIVDALVANFDRWAGVFESSGADPVPTTIRVASNAGIGRIVAPEITSDLSSRWIIAGLSHWVWRELVFTTLRPEGANRYATMVPLLLVPTAKAEPLNLEQWPTENEDFHVDRGFQVFLNIAEHHGKEAIPQLMAQFWKLPSEQRTTAGLKGAYGTLWNEPLEARAPWRSLGHVP